MSETVWYCDTEALRGREIRAERVEIILRMREEQRVLDEEEAALEAGNN